MSTSTRAKLFLFLLPAFLCISADPASAQSREGIRRATAERYLNDLHADVKRAYYDRTFRGVDIETAYDSAKARLKRASTDQERFLAIDSYLRPLKDSHTYFIGLLRISVRDFNLDFRFYGDDAFVTGVDPASHADSAGLRPGDQIVEFDGQPFTRESARNVVIGFLTAHPLRPLQLTVRAPDKSVATLSILPDTAAIYRMKGKQLRRMIADWRDSTKLATSHVQATVADTVFYWRLPHFDEADRGLNNVIKRAREHPIVILDLRGNPGGSIETLTKLTGFFIDKPLMVGDLHMRFGKEKFEAKPHKTPFTGKLLILVDSETASASEIFARLMQLAGRATVYGDRTAGAVMASLYYPYSDDAGASITISDFVLHNGERLEDVGVKPDVFLVPPPQHIGRGTDIVLAYVLAQVGARLSASAAAGLTLPR